MNKFTPLSLVFAAALILSACGHSNHAHWTPSYELPQALVQQAHDEFYLEFPKGYDAPYLDDKIKVARQLDTIKGDQVAQITVYASSDKKAAHAKKLVASAPHLKGAKVVVKNDRMLHDRAVIAVDHWAARVDDCPNWDKPHGTDYTNSNSANFGCASAMNLAMMVSNPHDLEQGRSMSEADSHQAIGSVVRYRSDDAPPLRREDGVLTGN